MGVGKVAFGYSYYLLASSITILFWILFSVFDQRLFFTPYLVFYIPIEGTIDLILSTMISIMLGLIITMNVYYFVNALRNQKGMQCRLSLSVLPGTLSVLSSVCVGCSSLSMGTVIISLFGITWASALSFLTSYHTPIRLVSLALLACSFYFLNKNIAKMTCSK